MHKTTIGVFDSGLQAKAAIEEIKGQGVPDTDISFVYMDTVDGRKETIVERTTSRAASGAATGAVVGTAAGLAVASGILPGLGALFVAGPLATALGLAGGAATTAAGAMTGAAAGGLIGALGGLGVSDEEARRYEERVRGGGILVTVHNDNPEVARIFEEHGADDIREY